MNTARIYLRVSSKEQDLERQESIISETEEQGYYIAGVYREKASGARRDRPELQRLINDLQKGDVVVAERIDRISRLPLKDAEALIDSIKSKGAVLSIPNLIDLSEILDKTSGTAKIVLETMQTMLLRLALQAARDDYELRKDRQKQGIKLAKDKSKYKGRQEDRQRNELITELRCAGKTIAETEKLSGASKSQVKRVWRIFKENHPDRFDEKGKYTNAE